jgi:predicted alternative tryptophan synthase beta-subunit
MPGDRTTIYLDVFRVPHQWYNLGRRPDPRRSTRPSLGPVVARVYYTRRRLPAGSHKPNTAVPQAFSNARQGIRRLTTETGRIGAPGPRFRCPGAPMATLSRWNVPCSTARRTS